MQTTTASSAPDEAPWIPPPPRPFRRQAAAIDVMELAFRLEAWGRLGTLWAGEPCR